MEYSHIQSPIFSVNCGMVAYLRRLTTCINTQDSCCKDCCYKDFSAFVTKTFPHLLQRLFRICYKDFSAFVSAVVTKTVVTKTFPHTQDSCYKDFSAFDMEENTIHAYLLINKNQMNLRFTCGDERNGNLKDPQICEERRYTLSCLHY